MKTRPNDSKRKRLSTPDCELAYSWRRKGQDPGRAGAVLE